LHLALSIFVVTHISTHCTQSLLSWMSCGYIVLCPSNIHSRHCWHERYWNACHNKDTKW